MQLDDKIKKSVSDVLNRWNSVAIPVQIEDQSLKIHVDYFSAFLRSSETEIMSYTNGERVKKKPKTREISSMFVKAYIGKNDPRGSLLTGIGINDLPENKSHLKKELDEVMDSWIKESGLDYLMSAGQAIIYKDNIGLESRGKPQKIVYHQPENNSKNSILTFEKDLINVQKKILKLKDIIDVKVTSSLEKEHSLFIDTDESDISQNKEHININITLRGTDKHGVEFPIGTSLNFANFEQYDRKILDRKLEKMIDLYEAHKNIQSINSGTYPIIMDGKAVATFIHESITAHLLSGLYIAENLSTVFSGRLGEQILPDYLTLIDDPTIPNTVAHYKYDEEGVEAKKVVLVENGVLKNYLLDRSSAIKLSKKFNLNLEPNGHTRSEWATDSEGNTVFPEPRATNLIVTSSDLKTNEELFEQLAKVVKDKHLPYGLLIVGGGGHVDIESSSFELNPGNSWKVYPSGKRELVSDIKIVGNSDTFFDLVLATGYPYSTSYGFCGSSSGYVPTQQRAPALLLKSASVISEIKDDLTDRLVERIK